MTMIKDTKIAHTPLWTIFAVYYILGELWKRPKTFPNESLNRI